MILTVAQVAAQLGKSQRQVRYMIVTGRLLARKVGSMYQVDSATLPRSDGQQRAGKRKQRRLRAAVAEALDIEPDASSRRHSLRNLRAVQVGCRCIVNAYLRYADRYLFALHRALCDGHYRPGRFR